VSHAATSRTIWDFEGFPASYVSLLGESQGPVGPDVLLELAALPALAEEGWDHLMVLDEARRTPPIVLDGR
jgi:hypothetical protein